MVLLVTLIEAYLSSRRPPKSGSTQAVANANAKCVAAAARSTTLRLDVARAEVRAADAEAQQDKARVKQAAAEVPWRRGNDRRAAHRFSSHPVVALGLGAEGERVRRGAQGDAGGRGEEGQRGHRRLGGQGPCAVSLGAPIEREHV